ncbi:hypothetical protein PINS_up014994 [Pythium insidiosum]|nr:hypothetical protein PINS_up014994 [Pythium insidiosum]
MSSRDRLHPKSPYLQTAFAAGNNATTRRSAQNLHATARERDEQRPLTADSSKAQVENQEDDAATSTTPIVRHGMKSVKALRKLSPYNVKLKKSSESRRLPSPLHQHLPKPPAPNTSAATAASISNSVRDIGMRLQVYQFRYDCWYPCTIVGFDNKRKLHCCQYEYGDKQWQNLSERKIEVLGRGDDAS